VIGSCFKCMACSSCRPQRSLPLAPVQSLDSVVAIAEVGGLHHGYEQRVGHADSAFRIQDGRNAKLLGPAARRRTSRDSAGVQDRQVISIRKD
jgi:hypothetical protein